MKLCLGVCGDIWLLVDFCQKVEGISLMGSLVFYLSDLLNLSSQDLEINF